LKGNTKGKTMYTKNQLKQHIKDIGIKGSGTLLVHSSMKAMGEVDGGVETVLDAFIEYMSSGLLIFPTHSWNTINKDNPIFDPAIEPSCVGLLTNLFLKRTGVIRSWHPTHSVAALGEDAEEYTVGEELTTSPCSRTGCWGKLYDRNAQILFLGCSTKRNTFIHGVEEWYNIPNRLAPQPDLLKIRKPDGKLIDCPQYRHQSPVDDISQNYDKIQPLLRRKGIAISGRIGDAQSVLCEAVPMADLTGDELKKNPDYFLP
jgi:aminoglycoside 3-N-acetyltransferase